MCVLLHTVPQNIEE
jgi:hypothetical protein